MKQHCFRKALMFVPFFMPLLLLLMLLLLFWLPLLFLLLQLQMPVNQIESDEITCVLRTLHGLHRNQGKGTRDHATARALATKRAHTSKHAHASTQT